MASAGYDGFFSGHSLRRTGGSRLFQAGVQRKLVKEVTGHASDAIDKYQVTSDSQRAAMSNILQGNDSPKLEAKSEFAKVSGDALKLNVFFQRITRSAPMVVRLSANVIRMIKVKLVD